ERIPPRRGRKSESDPKRNCERLASCLKVLTSVTSIGTKQAMKRRKIQQVYGRVAVPGPINLPIELPGGLDARFCEVMDVAPVMIWVSNTDKQCVWFNLPWLNFTGRDIQQELGDGWLEGVHPEDIER